jgi:hypothetical protein
LFDGRFFPRTSTGLTEPAFQHGEHFLITGIRNEQKYTLKPINKCRQNRIRGDIEESVKNHDNPGYSSQQKQLQKDGELIPLLRTLYSGCSANVMISDRKQYHIKDNLKSEWKNEQQKQSPSTSNEAFGSAITKPIRVEEKVKKDVANNGEDR